MKTNINEIISWHNSLIRTLNDLKLLDDMEQATKKEKYTYLMVNGKWKDSIKRLHKRNLINYTIENGCYKLWLV